MSRVMTFSRVYPSYHPKAGQPTYFVEKIWNSIGFKNAIEDEGVFNKVHSLTGYDVDFIQRFFDTLGHDVNKKHHTIRYGHRWKEGDWFSPRVWSGKPRRSLQITFAPDIQVKKVWSFSIALDGLYVDQQRYLILSGLIKDVAANDGLDLDDFLDWFRYPKRFDGQIICWNESIEY